MSAVTTRSSSYATIDVLDVTTFKVVQCQKVGSHDRKSCLFYHGLRDKRRFPETYRPEQCEMQFDLESTSQLCPNGDACPKSHNRHELLYHSRMYKTRFCASYPNQDCPRGGLCAFAHTRNEIKCQLFSFDETKNPDSEFFMTRFKTLWCPFGSQHDWHSCLYAHTFQDCRRDPKAGYGSEPCKSWQKDIHTSAYDRKCPKGISCTNSHGSKEQLYHPSYYLTMPCTDYQKTGRCPRGLLCAFFHEQEQKRIIETQVIESAALSPHQLSKIQINFTQPPLFNLDDFEAFGSGKWNDKGNSRQRRRSANISPDRPHTPAVTPAVSYSPNALLCPSDVQQRRHSTPGFADYEPLSPRLPPGLSNLSVNAPVFLPASRPSSVTYEDETSLGAQKFANTSSLGTLSYEDEETFGSNMLDPALTLPFNRMNGKIEGDSDGLHPFNQEFTFSFQDATPEARQDWETPAHLTTHRRRDNRSDMSTVNEQQLLPSFANACRGDYSIKNSTAQVNFFDDLDVTPSVDPPLTGPHSFSPMSSHRYTPTTISFSLTTPKNKRLSLGTTRAGSTTMSTSPSVGTPTASSKTPAVSYSASTDSPAPTVSSRLNTSRSGVSYSPSNHHHLLFETSSAKTSRFLQKLLSCLLPDKTACVVCSKKFCQSLEKRINPIGNIKICLESDINTDDSFDVFILIGKTREGLLCNKIVSTDRSKSFQLLIGIYKKKLENDVALPDTAILPSFKQEMNVSVFSEFSRIFDESIFPGFMDSFECQPQKSVLRSLYFIQHLGRILCAGRINIQTNVSVMIPKYLKKYSKRQESDEIAPLTARRKFLLKQLVRQFLANNMELSHIIEDFENLFTSGKSVWQLTTPQNENDGLSFESILQLREHPIFWTTMEKLQFLGDISTAYQKDESIRNVIDCFTIHEFFSSGSWIIHIDESIQNAVKNYLVDDAKRNFEPVEESLALLKMENSIIGLLQFIKNCTRWHRDSSFHKGNHCDPVKCHVMERLLTMFLTDSSDLFVALHEMAKAHAAYVLPNFHLPRTHWC